MDQNTTISLGDAYRAMFSFLDAYWRRGGRTQDDIAALLGSMQFNDEVGPRKPLDPAQWNDWLDAVKAVQ